MKKLTSVLVGFFLICFSTTVLSHNTNFSAYKISSGLTENKQDISKGFIHCNVDPVDLAVSLPFLNSNLYRRGAYIYFSFQLHNNSNALSDSFSIGLVLSADDQFEQHDLVLKTIRIDFASPFQTMEITDSLLIPDTITEGEYYLFTVVDYFNNLYEANRENNITCNFIRIFDGVCDLKVSELKVSRKNLYTNTSNEIRFVIENKGSDIVTDVNVSVVLSSSGETLSGEIPLGIFHYDSIQGNSLTNINKSIFIPDSVEAGTYFLFISIDNSSSIYETDESNNITFTEVNLIEGFVDLTAGFGIESAPCGFAPGAELIVNWSTCNKGNIESGFFSIKCYFSKDQIVDSSDIVILNSYASTLWPTRCAEKSFMTRRVPRNLEDGQHYIIFIVDENDAVEESNEDNNQKIIPVTIKFEEPYYDWSIRNLIPLSTKYDSLIIKYTFKQNSCDFQPDIKHYVKIGYYLSVDTILNIHHDLFLEEKTAGSMSISTRIYNNQRIYISDNIPPGQYYLFVVADYPDDYHEIDESNNYQYLPINIYNKELDIKLSKIDFRLVSDVHDFIYEIDCSVLNVSEIDADSCRIDYYVSQDSILDLST